MGHPRPCSIRSRKIGGIAGLTVQADGDETVRYGKSVGDLQENIAVNGNSTITGTLKYVTGYTSFSSNPDEQSGNYLALSVDFDDGATVTASLGNASVDITSDKYIVIRMTEARLAQTLTFTATKGGQTETKTYSLTALNLESA